MFALKTKKMWATGGDRRPERGYATRAEQEVFLPGRADGDRVFQDGRTSCAGVSATLPSINSFFSVRSSALLAL